MTPKLSRSTRILAERLQTKTKLGVLGREDGTIRASNGRYYVREYLSSNRLAPAVALPIDKNAQIPVRYNIAVTLGHNSKGQRVILGHNQQGSEIQGIPPSATNMADPQNQRVYKDQILPLRGRPSRSAGKAMYAEVLPDNFVIGDTYYEWAGGEIDLSGEVPSSGNHRYCVVFWRTSTNDLAHGSSTAQSTSTPLDDTDVQQAIDDGAYADGIPIKAFVLTGDMTALDGSATGCKDIRTTFNPFTGGDGTVTSVAFTAAPTGIFDVSGSPITTAGTIALSMDTQSANTVLAGPTTGGAATPAFRALVAADVPDISGTYVPKSLYDANTVLKADSDDTPVALTMGASTILARLDAGNIVAATVAQIKTLLAIAVADIVDIATTYANVALSNLASVAINTSLISDTNNTDDLGSTSINWRDLFATNVKLKAETPGILQWLADSYGKLVGAVRVFASGSGANWSAEGLLYAVAFGTGHAVYQLFATRDADGATAQIRLDTDITTVSAGGWMSFTDPVGNIGSIYGGTVHPAFSFINTTATETLIDGTIEANTLGTKGVFRTRRVVFTLLNTTGGSGAFATIGVNFGSYSKTFNTGNINNGQRVIGAVELEVWQNQATGTQRIRLHISYSTNPADNTFVAKTLDQWLDTTTSQDGTADIAWSITGDMSASGMTLIGHGMSEAYYGA